MDPFQNFPAGTRPEDVNQANLDIITAFNMRSANYDANMRRLSEERLLCEQEYPVLLETEKKLKAERQILLDNKANRQRVHPTKARSVEMMAFINEAGGFYSKYAMTNEEVAVKQEVNDG